MSLVEHLFRAYVDTATIIAETFLIMIKLYISFIFKIVDLIIGNGSNYATTPMLDDFGALLPLLYDACEAIVILVATGLGVYCFMSLWWILAQPRSPPPSFCKNQ